MRRLMTCIAPAVFAVLPFHALAAEPEQTRFKDWTRVCYTAADQSRCEAVQVVSVTQQEQAQPILRATLTSTGPDGGDQRFLEIALPLGMDLRAGIVFQIDQGDEIQARYTTCIPQGCAAVLPADDQLMAAMRAGAQAKVGFRPFGTTQTQVVNLSLSGFTAASREI